VVLKDIGVCDNRKKTTYNVMAVHTATDNYFVMVVHPKYKERFLEAFQDKSFYLDYVYFESEDDKTYSTFTICRTSCRGRKITEEQYLKLKDIASAKQSVLKPAV
jgi:hypothetical protein